MQVHDRPSVLVADDRVCAIPSRVDVLRARDRVGSHLRRTPLLEVDPLALGVAGDIRLLLKLELLQHTGSFKARGAAASAATIVDGVPGLVTASGGNHGAAVAWAGATRGLPTVVFVPAFSPPAKRARIVGFGGRVVPVDGPYAAAAEAAQAFAREHGFRFVHAFDDPDTVAGAGTLGLDLLDEVPTLDHVVVAVGGGGLYAGVAVACEGMAQVSAVEPEQSPALAAATAAGRRVDVAVGGVAVDSTGATRVGAIGYAVARRLGETGRLVSDPAIVAAQLALWDTCRVLAEPGGAVALAGLRTGVVRPEPGSTVVAVVCGGNTTTLPTL